MHILDDTAYYIEAYAQFTSLFDKSKDIEELAESVFVKFVVEQLKTKDTNIRMLGIGSSTGRTETVFIKRLLDRFPNIENTVVEPNAEAIAEYQSSIKGKWNNVEFSWFNGTFKQFREQLEATGNDKKFHHINAVDAVYNVDNLKEAIIFMYDKLEEGGVMLILVCSDQSSMYKIKQRYPSVSGTHGVSSTEVIDICQKNRIPFHFHHEECLGDITGLYSSEGMTRNEKLLLDFSVQMKDFKENVSESFYDEIIAFIKSSDCSKKIGGKLLLRNDIDMIFINKLG